MDGAAFNGSASTTSRRTSVPQKRGSLARFLQRYSGGSGLPVTSDASLTNCCSASQSVRSVCSSGCSLNCSCSDLNVLPPSAKSTSQHADYSTTATDVTATRQPLSRVVFYTEADASDEGNSDKRKLYDTSVFHRSKSEQIRTDMSSAFGAYLDPDYVPETYNTYSRVRSHSCSIADLHTGLGANQKHSASAPNLNKVI